jgi:hypothetical protein
MAVEHHSYHAFYDEWRGLVLCFEFARFRAAAVSGRGLDSDFIWNKIQDTSIQKRLPMRKQLNCYVREFSEVWTAARILVAGALIAFTGCSGAPVADSSGRSGSVASDVSGQNRFTANDSSARPAVQQTEPSNDSSAVPAAPIPIRHTSDTDKDFLHHMLDHYEAVLVLVHADMMKPEGHGMHDKSGDPVESDAALDAEKTQMLRLLKKLYGEDYSPRPVSAAKAAVEKGNKVIHASLATHFRSGVSLVDRSVSGLRNSQVRALAKQMRVTQLALLKTTPREMAPQH